MEDAGMYKCRIDYKMEQTSFQNVNFTVVEIPSEPVIQRKGVVVNRWIEVKEGESYNLECNTNGGVPSPKVTWWKERTLIDSSFAR